ncbi:YciI family protein [Phenylobacterium sp.]|uniref:YciI family protein n=1 Tax=Phenylobacterium sp. TaxID=1871053 RepID=UPI0012187D4E|nr:YciI family protein [Phenylobacterium sp.]THD65026.1 MAG: YciI family protein [Phenylobacterium sp.]
MRVMVFGMATEGVEKGEPPTAEAWAAMDRFMEDLAEAGVLVAAAGLKPTSEGKELLFDGDEIMVVDGPFAEAKEVVAGFSIWEVRDMDEAVAWAKRSPNPTSGQSRMVIRPFFEVADIAEYLTPEDLASPRTGERAQLGVA